MKFRSLTLKYLTLQPSFGGMSPQLTNIEKQKLSQMAETKKIGIHVFPIDCQRLKDDSLKKANDLLNVGIY
jgi:hypothetical protein